MIFQAKGLVSQPPILLMTTFRCTNPSCRKEGKYLRQQQGRRCRKCYAPIEVTGTMEMKNPKYKGGEK